MSRDCHAGSVTKKGLERVSGLPGLFDALQKVGWLTVEVDEITLPNFGRHNGQTAKQRALTSKRQEKKRHAPVTEMSRSQRDESVTREEKRREEEMSTSLSPEPSPRGPITPDPEESTSVIPTADQVRTYAEGIGYQINAEYFCDHYGSTNLRAANGQPITNWKSLVRKWKINDEAKRHQDSLGKRAANGLSPGQVIHDDRPETNAAAARLLEADRKGLRGY
jgi:hypothetical protein